MNLARGSSQPAYYCMQFQMLRLTQVFVCSLDIHKHTVCYSF